MWPTDDPNAPVPSTAANVAIDLVALILIAFIVENVLALFTRYAP